MEPLESCRFCDIAIGKYYYPDIDEPFARNDNFIAVASIGALVEGWSLIIPKAHQHSMRHIYGSDAFTDFVGAVLPSLSGQYGQLIAFEHGANKKGSVTACGTDHAHLHLVPLRNSLLPQLQGSGLSWINCRSSEIALISREKEYLYYCELGAIKTWQDPIGYLHILKEPISQFFRRLIATQIGNDGAFDYRRFPHLDTSRQTRSMLIHSFV